MGGSLWSSCEGEGVKNKMRKAEEAQSPSHPSPLPTPGSNYSHGVDRRERVLFSSLDFIFKVLFAFVDYPQKTLVSRVPTLRQKSSGSHIPSSAY